MDPVPDGDTTPDPRAAVARAPRWHHRVGHAASSACSRTSCCASATSPPSPWRSPSVTPRRDLAERLADAHRPPRAAARSTQFVEAALYGDRTASTPRAARAGRRGDFLTVARGRTAVRRRVARALDAWWGELGRPDPYVVVEAGAGPGHARPRGPGGPACAPALRYVLVERRRLACRTPTRLPPSPSEVRGIRPTTRPSHSASADRRQPARAARSLRGRAGQRAARQPAVRPRRARRRLARGVRRRRRATARSSRCSCPLGRARRARRCPPTAARRCSGPAASGRPRRGWRDALDRARAGPGRGLRLRRRTTAELAVAPVAGVAAHLPRPRARRPPLADPGTQDITIEVALDQLAWSAARPRADTGRVPAPPRHRRARRGGPAPLGRAGRARPTSTRCGPAAGSARPRRSPTRPGSARSPCRVGRRLTPVHPRQRAATRVLVDATPRDRLRSRPSIASRLADRPTGAPLHPDRSDRTWGVRSSWPTTQHRADDRGRSDRCPTRTARSRRRRRSRRTALVADTSLYDEAADDYEGFWARQAAELLDWATEWDTDLRVGAAVRQVVRRRPAQRLVQLPRPPRRSPARATRWPSTGRASRATPAPSPTPSCSTRCSGSPTC